MKKNTLILSFIGIVIVVLLIIIAIVKQSNNTVSNQTTIRQLQVATDPNFPEIKGQLMPGFPQFPIYPGATLEASAKTNPEGQPDTGYRAKWVTEGNVPTVMKWYQNELPKNDWQFDPPKDMNNTGEQVAKIAKGNLSGNIVIEAGQGSKSEIVVEVRKIN